MQSATRRTLVGVAKTVLAVAILGYLVIQAREGFGRLLEQTIDWSLLALGLLCTVVASLLSFVRWHLLILAVGITIRLIDTLRLSVLGMALNFVSPGAIGGDFFKAIFLAHGQPGRRTEAVATVVADRLMGLLTQLAMASGAILATDLLAAPSPAVRILCQIILAATVVSWTAFGVLFLAPRLPGSRFCRRAETIPFVGRTIARLLAAGMAYRAQRGVLLAGFGLSLVSALLYITAYYLMARGLPIHEPPWSEHLVIVPVAGLVAAIPITPNGLGTLELAIEELYKVMPGGMRVEQGDGTMVALARRVAELAEAVVGLVFYLTHRRQMKELYAEAEQAAETE